MKKTIVIKWHIDDVLMQAEKQKIKLTKKQAKSVLMLIKKSHDAEIGVNWQVINNAINIIKGDVNEIN